MKWFFCWCQETDFRDDHNWKDLIRASVESAQQNTSFEPHFIYDGRESDFTEELQKRGVNIHFHKVSFFQSIEDHRPGDLPFQAIARGAFLRFEIPLFAGDEDEFVLYTDADIIFQKEPQLEGYCPAFLAAAPQMERGERTDMNSGVMLLNVPEWKRQRDQFIEFTQRNLHVGLDQEVLRVYLGERYLMLPDEYNWKPYWGVRPEAPIIHWHGPKPETAVKLLNREIQQTHESWQVLFDRSPEAYALYCVKHHELLNDYWRRQKEISARYARENMSFVILVEGQEVIEQSLAKGQRVVAVQPDVRLYYALAEHFAAPIAEGRLVLENFAPAQRSGEIALLQPGDGGKPYPVATIGWAELVAKHGVPSSVKMGADIPGYPAVAG